MVYPDSWKCPNCNKIVKNNKICSNCRFKYSMHYPNLWQCPECRELVSDSVSCPKCNYPNELHYPHLWHCPKCNNLVHSSTKCSECGYETREEKLLEESKDYSLQKKISSYGDIIKKRKNVLLASIGIITILGVLLILSTPTTPVNTLVAGNVVAGESFTPYLTTSSAAQSVNFILTSPNGNSYEYPGELDDKGNWVVNDLVLNESGEWRIITQIKSFSSVTELINSINATKSCDSNKDCNNGICCYGSCVKLCGNDNDCDDGNEFTTNTCVSAGSCSAKCVFKEPACFSSVSDDYCPSNCSLENDIDCNNCPVGKVLCNNQCYKPCYTNSDCSDGDSSTSDTCVASSNPCNSYCTHTYYSDMGCPSGKIRVGNTCISPSCFTDEDCDDGRSNYAHKCYFGGTENSYCYHQPCSSDEIVCKVNGVNTCVKPACSSNSDCNDGTPNKEFYCMNHDSCAAYCTSSCKNGFKLYNNECLPQCTSIIECASYEGLYTPGCVITCGQNETCLTTCLSGQPLKTKCDYVNNVCKPYDCVNNAGCNDSNACTIDVCTDNRCTHTYLGDNKLVNNNENACCNGGEAFYCTYSSKCNTPNYFYNFSVQIPTLDYDLPGGRVHFDNTENPKIMIVDLQASDTNRGVYFTGINCVDNSPFIISADIKTVGGVVGMWYSANDYNSPVYNNITSNGYNVWQTYTINGTMDCSKPDKSLVIYGMSPEIMSFYIDNVTVITGYDSPRYCNNAVICKTSCDKQYNCVNGDGVCPAGCFNNVDNDCKVCQAPDIYCGNLGCSPVECYSNSDCSWFTNCMSPGSCTSMCVPVPDYEFDFSDSVLSNVYATSTSASISIVNEKLKVVSNTVDNGAYFDIKSECVTGNNFMIDLEVEVTKGCSVEVSYPAGGNAQTFDLGTGVQTVSFSGTMTCAGDNNDSLFFKTKLGSCSAYTQTEFTVDNAVIFIQ
ncbi:MAG: hypothetical protein JW791_01945 [Nanoarchaeota archaeon]|nr:hypothetical protein [Nanoarchaeota archaeon]